MDAIYAELQKLVDYYPTIAVVFTLVAVFLLTWVTKKPIKMLTAKIKNELIRKRVNTVICILPFLYGLLFAFIYTYFGYAFRCELGLSFGAIVMIVYEVVTRIFPNFKIGVLPTKEELDQAVNEAVESTTEAKTQAENVVKKVKEEKAKIFNSDVDEAISKLEKI